MTTSSRSYSSVVSEDLSTVRSQVFKLIRDGKSSELGAYLCERRYARNLLTLVKTNPWNNECLSLLMIAILHGHDTIVREILSHSPDRTKTIELEGRVYSVSGDLVDKVTALWCALDRAHFDVARTLIDVGKANVNHGPVHPLLIDATIRERLDIVQFLIENNYADINQTKTNDGNTALAMAAMEGRFQSVWFLSMASTSSRTRNLANKTPIVLAAENNQLNIVQFLLEHDNASFDDLEFAVASHILSEKGTENYKSQWVIELLRYSLVQRIELNVHKSVAQPIVAYNFEKECQSIEEFDSIKENEDRLYIEALLIHERVLLAEKDNKLFSRLFDEATKLIAKGQFDRCLNLIVHIFHLSQQFQFHNCFKEFFWLFYDMFNSKISIPADQFWKTCDLVFKPSEEDHKQDKSYLLGARAKMDPPEISLILNKLELTDDLVANIYFHGSWAQGTCTNKSDQDLIIVTRTFKSPLRFHADFDYFHGFELHKLFDKYDVCVYSVENFEELLKKNYLFCVQCLFLPNEFKLKEEIDFRKIYFEKYYDQTRIKKVAFYEMYHSLNLMNPTRSSIGNQSREDFLFKNLFHGIRFLDMALQLIQLQTIQDFTSVSHLFYTMNEIRRQSNIDGVLQFVNTTSDEFKSKLDLLLPTTIIKGIFQLQITFDCQLNFEEIFEKLKIKCQNTKNKNLFIYLDDDDQKIEQLIVRSTYLGEYPSIIQQIQNDIHQHFQDFSIKNIQIKSSTLNQGIPINEVDKQLFWTNTFQFNYKVSIDEQFFKIIKNKLKSNTKFNSFTYFIKRINHQKFDYFIQMSLTNVGLDKALQMSNEFISYLKIIPRKSYKKIEQQFIVYDKNFI